MEVNFGYLGLHWPAYAWWGKHEISPHSRINNGPTTKLWQEEMRNQTCSRNHESESEFQLNPWVRFKDYRQPKVGSFVSSLRTKGSAKKCTFPAACLVQFSWMTYATIWISPLKRSPRWRTPTTGSETSSRGESSTLPSKPSRHLGRHHCRLVFFLSRTELG